MSRRRRNLDTMVRLRIAGQREQHRIPLGSRLCISRGAAMISISVAGTGAIHGSRMPAGWTLEIGHRAISSKEPRRARGELWLTLWAPGRPMASVLVFPTRGRR